MNQPGNAGFAYDYALLRATPGCDLDELKRCYRLAVRGLHPDLNPELASDSAAQDALSELTTAYRRLLDQKQAPLEALVRTQVEAQLALIDSGMDAARIKPVRNPWME